MDNLSDLSNQFENLKKKIKQIRKENMQQEDFLHSGELSLMKFIEHYYMKFGDNPTLVIVSNVIGISAATATTLADRLIKKGLINKEVSPTDKRAKVIYITEKGRAYLNSNKKRDLEMLSKVIESIGNEDTVELIRILGKINLKLDQYI